MARLMLSCMSNWQSGSVTAGARAVVGVHGQTHAKLYVKMAEQFCAEEPKRKYTVRLLPSCTSNWLSSSATADTRAVR